MTTFGLMLQDRLKINWKSAAGKFCLNLLEPHFFPPDYHLFRAIQNAPLEYGSHQNKVSKTFILFRGGITR